jgi:putative hemolysin
MELITPKDFLSANKYLKYLGGEKAARKLMDITKLSKFNEEYASLISLSGPEFVDGAIKVMGFTYEIDERDLERIPKEGPFITVHNHPFGGFDGLLLMKLLPQIRPDYKILVNFLLTKLGPIEPYFLAVNPFESYKDVKSSLSGLKEAFSHIRCGGALGIYPAGEVSTYRFDQKRVTDRLWQNTVMKFVKKTKVPVVPIYFHGQNSAMFHFLGMIHPLLRTVKLPSELFNKPGYNVKVRIGSPVSVKDQETFSDIFQYTSFLRTKIYAFSVPIRAEEKTKKKKVFKPDNCSGPNCRSCSIKKNTRRG